MSRGRLKKYRAESFKSFTQSNAIKQQYKSPALKILSLKECCNQAA